MGVSQGGGVAWSEEGCAWGWGWVLQRAGLPTAADMRVLVLDKVARAARQGHGVSTRERTTAGQICLGRSLVEVWAVWSPSICPVSGTFSFLTGEGSLVPAPGT